jgi:hypothetical protein
LCGFELQHKHGGSQFCFTSFNKEEPLKKSFLPSVRAVYDRPFFLESPKNEAVKTAPTEENLERKIANFCVSATDSHDAPSRTTKLSQIKS